MAESIAGLLVLVESSGDSLRPLVVENAAVIFPSSADFMRYKEIQGLRASAQVVPALKKRDLLGFLRIAKEAGARMVLIASETPDVGDIDAQIDRLSGGSPAPTPAPAPVAAAPEPEPVPLSTGEEAAGLVERGLSLARQLASKQPGDADASLKAVLGEINRRGATGPFLAVRARLANEIIQLVDRKATQANLELLAETRDPGVVECLARHLDLLDGNLVAPRPALRAIFTFGRAAVPGLVRQASVEESGLRMEILADALLTIAGGREAGDAVRIAVESERDSRRRERLRSLLQRMQAAYGN